MIVEREFLPLHIAVLTISDTRDLAHDLSGDSLVARLEQAGHKLAARTLVRDEIDAIQACIKGWCADSTIDVILTTGGTGLTGRDVTIEAIRPLFDKEIDGFSTVFHMLSYPKIGTATMQSRTTAGVSLGTYIFCLPGSPGACRDAWEGILQFQLDYRHKPCNFVEIIPRLEEHLKRQKS